MEQLSGICNAHLEVGIICLVVLNDSGWIVNDVPLLFIMRHRWFYRQVHQTSDLKFVAPTRLISNSSNTKAPARKKTEAYFLI